MGRGGELHRCHCLTLGIVFAVHRPKM
jgi:hypothetical protein